MERLLFMPLDEPKRRTKSFVAGWVVQFTLVTAALMVGAVLPKTIPMVSRYVATNLVLTPAPVPQTPQPRVKFKVSPHVETAEHALVVPTAPVRHVEHTVDPTPPAVIAALDIPKMPDVVSTGSSARPTLMKQPIKVQTGGFGDPNGIPAKGDGKHAVNIAGVGAFDLPPGEGHGNGTGGKKGVPGITVSTGFGNGTATGGAGRHVEVTASNFDEHQIEEKKVQAVNQAPTTPAQILAKPKPLYTDEARKLRIEGVVRVEVRLTAKGKVEVLNVLNGLGHGLDEQAVAVVQQISFKPAQREGQSTDSTVVLSVIFQLAS